ncbi:MAG: tetratricopeptide repeat protein [Anaerolineae bacterium]|nr:tetratricopeptide repeat protein [Anaerolineae bacterium]
MTRRVSKTRKPGARKTKASDILKWLWAVLGAVAMIVGFALDAPEFIGRWLGHRPFKPAAESEVLVIVTDFTGDETIETDTRIYRTLSERVEASQLENVRVERLTGNPPLVARDAIKIGEEYNATLVIWGTADQYGLEPRYEVVRNQELIPVQAEFGITTADLPTFSAYVAQGASNEFEYLMLFSLGQIAYYSGDYQQAFSLLNEALDIHVDPARQEQLGWGTVYFYQGYAAQQTGDDATALESYSKAIEFSPRNSAAYYNRGLIYDRQGSTRLAITDYSTAITLNAGDARYFVNRGRMYFILGDYESARQDYDEALRLNPELASAYVNRGLLYHQEGDIDAAIADYNRGLDLEPDNPFALNNRAFAYAVKGVSLSEALVDASAAIDQLPDNGNFYDTRGLVYLKMGNPDAALIDYNAALDLNTLYAYYGRGMTYETLGMTDQAISDYTTFLDLYPNLDPESVDARLRLDALIGGQ